MYNSFLRFLKLFMRLTFRFYFYTFPVDEPNTRDNQELEFVQGLRGTVLLLIDGYTLPRGDMVGRTTFWHCRSRQKGSVPCNARVRTKLKPNGLFKITLTQPIHNHKPTHEAYRRTYMSRGNSSNSSGTSKK